MFFIVEAGELISLGSKPFEAGELITYNFQSALQEFWVEAMMPLLMTKFVELFGFVLMSHDLSEPIRIVAWR